MRELTAPEICQGLGHIVGRKLPSYKGACLKSILFAGGDPIKSPATAGLLTDLLPTIH